MKAISILLITLAINCLGLSAQPQQNKRAVTYFFMVNLDDNILKVLAPTTAAPKPNDLTNLSVNKMFRENIIDTFYHISSEKFKNEFGLNFMPLNTLQSAIRYNDSFPNCPNEVNIHKVLKSAVGYTYYSDFLINVFSDVSFEKIDSIHSPSQIKPLYALAFNLYDYSGKLIEKICYTYKSKNSLAEGPYDLNKMKAEICQLFSEALNEFTVLHKKNLVAQL